MGGSGLVSGCVASEPGLLPDKHKHKKVNFLCYYAQSDSLR